MDTIKEYIDSLDKTDIILYIAIIGIIIAFISLLIYIKRRDSNKNLIIKKKKKDAELEKLYFILSENKFTRLYVKRLTKRFEQMSIFSDIEIRRGVARYTKKLFWYVMLSFIFGCLVFDDIFSVLIIVTYAYVVYSTQIELNLQHSIVRLYKDLKNCMSSIRLEYKKCNDVTLAIENASYSNRVAVIMTELKHLLSSTSGEKALTDFYEKIPFKCVQTLAMICYHINNTGDEKHGDSSTFDEAMLVMNSDVNQKIEQFNYENLKFGKLEYLTFAGPIMAIVLKYLLSYMMPSVTLFYNSIAGLLIQNGIMIYSVIAYYQIAHAHIKNFLDKNDRIAIVDGLMKNKKIKEFMEVMSPKDRDRRILKAQLTRAFSQRTVEEFICEKWLIAGAAFAIVLGITFVSPIIQKNFATNYIGAFDLTSSVTYEDDEGNTLYTKKEVLAMDEEYCARRDSGVWVDPKSDETDLAIQAFISEHLKDLTTLDMESQKSRLESKYQAICQAKYHWWYMFFGFIAGIIGYQVPAWRLKKRTQLAKDEEEEEYLQLQIVMMILASMNFDTMETLGHLAQIADIHKSMLLYCYYGYASDPIKELERMENITQSENFKQFIAKLKETVEDLSIKEAFADLTADREHICNERNAYIKERIDFNRAKMGQVALRPMQMAIFGMMVFPLLYTGLSEMMNIQESLTEI